MTRWEETERLPSPVEFYVDLKSTKKQFTYWDKEAQERKEFSFDKPFTILKVGISIWGIGLYSNEIENPNKEILYVRKSQWGVLVKWLWNDIKTTVENEWGKFQKVFTISYDGKIIWLILQWTSMVEFGKSIQWLVKHKNKVSFTGKWIEQTAKGKKFYIPVFAISDMIDPDEFTVLKQQAKKVEEYFTSRTTQISDESEQEITQNASDDELAFSDDEEDIPF